MAAQGQGRSKARAASAALDMLRPQAVGTAASAGPKPKVPSQYTSVAGSGSQVKDAARRPNMVAAPGGQTLEEAYGRPGQEATMQDKAQQGQEPQFSPRPYRYPPIAQPSVQYDAGNQSGASADYIGQQGSAEPMDRRTATVQYGEPGHEFVGGYQRWRQLLGQ